MGLRVPQRVYRGVQRLSPLPLQHSMTKTEPRHLVGTQHGMVAISPLYKSGVQSFAKQSVMSFEAVPPALDSTTCGVSTSMNAGYGIEPYQADIRGMGCRGNLSADLANCKQSTEAHQASWNQDQGPYS